MTDGAREQVDAPGARRSRLGTIGLAGWRTFVSLLSVTVLSLTFYGWQVLSSAQSNLTTTDLFDDKEDGAPPLDGAVDILLVGIDSRTDAQGNPLPPEVLAKLHAGVEQGDKQTDTMILVHIPQDGTSATAISFPRDSYVEIAGGYGNSRINSAFAFAYNETANTLVAQGETDDKVVQEQAKVAGRKNLIATIENLIGRPGMIDRYAEVNLASFYEITKAVEGVQVCLKEPVKEAKSGIDLPAGVQTIEGVDALAFVRQRIGVPGGDLGRIQRQQAFLSGLARKMLSSDILLSPTRLADVIEAVQKSVVLSEDWDLLEFANQMRGLTGGNIEFRTIPIVGDARINGAAVLEVDPAQVQAFVDELIPQEPEGDPRMDAPEKVPGAEAYAVDIYNGTGDPAVGDATRSLLAGQGFGGDSYASMDPLSSTVIYHAQGEQAGGELLRQALGGNLAVVLDPQLPAGTLAVHLGTDFTLPESTNQVMADSSQVERLLTNAPARQQTDAESIETAEDEPITAGGVPCIH
ncbi:LCP family protein [Saccharomonospora cyanea]|uniref:Cell envelope-related function transcriptional attenuator common domain n=1 Tax=Saccharomonospora cyanea NA-134 TaxID=882082 RepID=H5XIN5_9PSEU|nr:LCP family protein [Saccharomonospora cyanea]EHR59637.1 cell envelope-related function transcriptional attenuator common domain [Saccharomonospora cyanea NA-134]